MSFFQRCPSKLIATLSERISGRYDDGQVTILSACKNPTLSCRNKYVDRVDETKMPRTVRKAVDHDLGDILAPSFRVARRVSSDH